MASNQSSNIPVAPREYRIRIWTDGCSSSDPTLAFDPMINGALRIWNRSMSGGLLFVRLSSNFRHISSECRGFLKRERGSTFAIAALPFTKRDCVTSVRCASFFIFVIITNSRGGSKDYSAPSWIIFPISTKNGGQTASV